MAQPNGAQPNPLTNPNVENLWQSFLEYCYNLNQTRAAEDAEDIGVRQRELDVFLKLNTPESLAAYQGAVAFDAKWARIHAERTEFDAALIRQIFDSAIRLNVHLLNHPDDVPTNRNASAGAPSSLNGLNTLNLVGSPNTPSLARQSSVKFEPKIKSEIKSEPDVKMHNEHTSIIDPNRPTQLIMAQLTIQDIVVAFPKNSNSFYVMRCPVLGCGRAFQSAHGMFGHLSQSDTAHLDLFGTDVSQKKVWKAVEIAGIVVVDADPDTVEAHNAKAVEVLMAPHTRHGNNKGTD
ncbi:uncharacterized protein PAC_07119 [Phialocephala subalpina]|uniref:Uncharacterized protein n=1 Tax=Phialocephala subalpina TaxID=576137 RepID=A0A1L7WWT9_9HELO|nr:uncharacterized protein PAC_07119 [Phialocephala subalpina]